MEQGGAIETRERHEMNYVDLHEHIHSENRSVGHIKRNVVQPHLGNTAYSGIQRGIEYIDGGMFSGNQYNNGQNHNSISLNISGAASSGLLEHCMFPASSSSTDLSLSWNSGSDNYMLSSNNQAMGFLMNGHSGTRHFTENAWGHCKEKNVELVPGYYSYFNGSARSDVSPIISQSSGTLMHPEQGNGTSRNPGAFVRNIRNRSSYITGTHQSAYISYPNDLLAANFAAQPFPCATNTWLPQLGNNITAGGCHGWSYSNPMPMLNGKHVNSVFPGTVGMGMQKYEPVMPPLYPSPLHYSHEDQLLSESMQLHNHIGFTQAQIPSPFYQYQLNTEPRTLNPNNGIQSNPRLPSFAFASTSQQVARPNFQLLRAYEETLHSNGTLFESAGSSGLSWEDEGNVTDEHGDMRLDIDSMSYEELLALEEQIGNVNTGLTEDFISKNLKTCIHTQELVYPMSEHEPCVICQVDYEDGESLGALNCGHMYHSCCIKQWLLIKNICPICKTTALINA